MRFGVRARVRVRGNAKHSARAHRVDSGSVDDAEHRGDPVREEEDDAGADDER